MKSDFWHVWTIPLLLTALSLIGLIAALVGDNFWDGLSWLTLGVPLVVIGRFVMKPQQSKRKRV
ncbi:hypothetical protein [Spirosoma fluminis]